MTVPFSKLYGVCVYFLGKKIEKMSSNLVDFIFEEPKEGLLDFLLFEFASPKKFDDYIKVLSFYHV